MEYVAKFQEVDGVLCRFDTRIYLDEHNPGMDSVCVGAIIGKNPGSAMPSRIGELLPLELRRDKMLPTVGNRFAEAYAVARKQPPINAFVRVWNLFYVCNKDLQQAANIASRMAHQPICESEKDTVPFVWFGWGGSDATLNPFKRRFIVRSYPRALYFDNICREVIGHAPTEGSSARHTQGMPAAPVREYLARIV